MISATGVPSTGWSNFNFLPNFQIRKFHNKFYRRDQKLGDLARPDPS